MSSRIIVSETTGRWAFALRTVLVNSGVSLTEIIGLASAFERLQNDAQAMLAFEATETSAEEGLHLLRSIRQRDPNCGIVVMLDDTLADTVSLWYEAGALAVVASPRQLAPVASLIRRYFETHDVPPTTFREAVWQRLPWGELELQS